MKIYKIKSKRLKDMVKGFVRGYYLPYRYQEREQFITYPNSYKNGKKIGIIIQHFPKAHMRKVLSGFIFGYLDIRFASTPELYDKNFMLGVKYAIQIKEGTDVLYR